MACSQTPGGGRGNWGHKAVPALCSAGAAGHGDDPIHSVTEATSTEECGTGVGAAQMSDASSSGDPHPHDARESKPEDPGEEHRRLHLIVGLMRRPQAST